MELKMNEQEILDYLDNAIVGWRKTRFKEGISDEEHNMAVYYIDAFQSVRYTLFEEALKP